MNGASRRRQHKAITDVLKFNEKNFHSCSQWAESRSAMLKLKNNGIVSGHHITMMLTA
jgi:hypothetical protein